MKLHEYQAKALFEAHDIPIPKGEVVSMPEKARMAAQDLGGRAAVKAQVLVGGRGKAGGILIAQDPEEAQECASRILGAQIGGLEVKKVLVEAVADITAEIYLCITNDRTRCKSAIVASASGGVDIEEIAKAEPDSIVRQYIDPFTGLLDYQVRAVASGIDLELSLWEGFAEICHALYRCFVNNGASIAEVNPLIVAGDGALIALDGKMVLDDNAVAQSPELSQMRNMDDESPQEVEARKNGLAYVALDGNIGCMVNGAGLAMGTMDIIKYFGGAPANFLDIGGGAEKSKVTAAIRIILADSNVKALLINIFGGITRCDEVAQGLLDALAEAPARVPVVVRLVGTNEDEGRKMLADSELITATSLTEGVRKVIAAAQT